MFGVIQNLIQEDVASSFWSPLLISFELKQQGYRLGDSIEEYWKLTDAANWLHCRTWFLRNPGELKVLKVLIMALKETKAF